MMKPIFRVAITRRPGKRGSPEREVARARAAILAAGSARPASPAMGQASLRTAPHSGGGRSSGARMPSAVVLARHPRVEPGVDRQRDRQHEQRVRRADGGAAEEPASAPPRGIAPAKALA